MNRPSELHDDCNITRTLLLRSLIALFAAHAAPLALAQNRDAASESTASPQVPIATRLATVLVEGLGKRSSPDALDAGTVGGLGLRKVGEAADLSAASVRRIEDWIEQEGLATVGAGGQLGLASNFASRGFSANSQSASGLGSSRLFANGHPDIARRFTRDLSSVERVEFVLAQDSTLFGAASPGSALNYVLKQPSGRDVSAWSGSLGTTGLLQSAIDLDRPLTATTAVRVVASGLVGDVGVERIESRRGNLLLSLKTQVASTTLRLEAETQHNASPFVFGTVYTGGKFWYDTPLVSPLSAAARTYTRYGAYARTPFAVGNQVFDLSVHAQSAETKRDETLLGFWTVTGPAEVSGYYRELKEAHRQTDLGVQLGSSWQLANTQHRTQVVIQRNTQSLVFDGPQRIAGFNINLNAPDINVDISKLTLAPRTLVENSTELGLGIANRMQLGETVTLHLGLRRSDVSVDSAATASALKPVTRSAANTSSFGGAWQASPRLRVFVLRGESLEPARGQRRDGGYLEPIFGNQTSAGLEVEQGSVKFAVNAFDIRQSNLPGVDPVDRNFLINLGTVRSEGASASLSLPLGAIAFPGLTESTLSMRSQLTRQYARVVQRVSATQGTEVVGSPRDFGSLRFMSQQAASAAWLSFIGVGERPGDSNGSFTAPGYIRTDLGFTWTPAVGKKLDVVLLNARNLNYVQALSAADNVWQGGKRRLVATATLNW
jgi:hypothetical protein